MSLLLVDNQTGTVQPSGIGLIGRRVWPALRRGLLWMLAASGLALGLTGGTYLYIQRDGNFHVVEPGVLFRSSQLGGQALQDLARSHGVKTVVNLRGNNAGQPWYDEEVNALRAAGIQHQDIRLSAYKELSVQQMDEIVKLLARVPKPVLIHCESGADRTGLVSAIFRMSRGHDLQTAQEELTPKYGHFPYLLSKSGAMDRSLLAYARAHSPAP